MTQTAMKYTKVLWELSIPVEDVKGAARLYESSEELSQVLIHPEIPAQKKYAVIDRLFTPSVQSFLKVLCRQGEISYLPEIAQAYEAYAHEHKNVLDAQIVCVNPPDEKQMEGFRDFLKKQYQAEEVNLTIVREPSLIGGFLLRVQGEEYDYSLRGRLNRMAQTLYTK